MYPIEVDFEVFKELTNRRVTEDTTYNDVIRKLLNLGKANKTPSPPSSSSNNDDWVVKGSKFPAGTEFRARYKGDTITARVEGGYLSVNGKKFNSPSAAAVSITKSAVNGWRFWECKLPGSTTWQSMESRRPPTRI